MARSITQPFPVQEMVIRDALAGRETYVHRVGRTGRAGRPGMGISFVLADQAEDVRRIAAGLGLDGYTGKSERSVAAEPRRRKVAV